jgi:hypothetical protein
LVGGDGVERRSPFRECGSFRFEDARPVREFRWSKGLGHFPGWWWAATTGGHVGYESWLERDAVMLMDFDPRIVAVASQPFWMYWHDDRGRKRRHAPDYFARCADGSAMVVDVRADDRIEGKDVEAFEATAQACAEVGWQFRRVGVTDPVTVANVRWLSRYRHPRCVGSGRTVSLLLEKFTRPGPLWAVAAEVGDRLAVLPVLFHLMWRRELMADLTTRLSPATLVHRGLRGGGW